MLVAAPIEVSTITLQGEITDVTGTEFTIDSGERLITVDVSGLPYDPLDEQGNQQLQVGDRVSVSGTMDANFFEGRQLTAEWVVTLSQGDDATSS